MTPPESLTYAEGIELLSVCRSIGSLQWAIKKVVNDGESSRADRHAFLTRAARDLEEAAKKIRGLL